VQLHKNFREALGNWPMAVSMGWATMGRMVMASVITRYKMGNTRFTCKTIQITTGTGTSTGTCAGTGIKDGNHQLTGSQQRNRYMIMELANFYN
jgi:hypothetical protein